MDERSEKGRSENCEEKGRIMSGRDGLRKRWRDSVTLCDNHLHIHLHLGMY